MPSSLTLSPSMLQCRLLLDDALPGAWNMAVDEAILERAIAHPGDGPTLRWYRWQEPTLSLGYFQPFADRPSSLQTIACVRRVTGGGAILHDRELTYSLILPEGSWPGTSSLAIVEDFHDMLRSILPSPLDAALAGIAEQGPEPFLCFERRAKVDVVIGKRKVIGSAQRSRRGALLQHGSILLAASPLASHLAGIRDFTNELRESEFLPAVGRAVEERWGWQLGPGELTPEERQRANELVVEKYANDQWTKQR